jgi:hypothetical protein
MAAFQIIVDGEVADDEPLIVGEVYGLVCTTVQTEPNAEVHFEIRRLRGE